MENMIVSACLLGKNCKYSGGNNFHQGVVDFLREKEAEIHIIAVCPEEMGGLLTPRAPAEMQKGCIVTKDGLDVTKEFEKGAGMVAELAKAKNCRQAILKERSPSCGCGRIYDGTFTGTLIAGDGKTAEALKKIGVSVCGEGKFLK